VFGLGPAGGSALVAAAALALGGGEAANPACTQSGDRVRVALGADTHAALEAGSAGRILLDGERCGTRPVSRIATISLSGGPGPLALSVDLRGRRFAALTIRADLGDGDDRVDAGTWPGRLDVSAGPGADTLIGGRRGNRLAGGSGRDRLRGGPDRDRLAGGEGGDRCDGRGGRDVLLGCLPRWNTTSRPLGPELRRRMTGRSWHRGCPVGLGKLRLLRLPHWTMADHDVHAGRVIVHRDADRSVMSAMRSLLRHHFPIRRMEPIDRYGGDDHRSMNADNTSAFNCRFVAGTNRWSQHAFGRAIDLNPIENPYVTASGFVSPAAGRRYANRSRNAAGMVHKGDATVRAFARVGWGWGGAWAGTRDYQHFSANGR
jgi:Ca2+-binding RTX toxin-like protein